MGSEGYSPLFETKAAKGRVVYRVFAASIFVGICLIWSYRVKFVGGGGRWGWLGLFAAEIWFGFYWVITQAPRWNPIRRRTFKHKLSQRSASLSLSLSLSPLVMCFFKWDIVSGRGFLSFVSLGFS